MKQTYCGKCGRKLVPRIRKVTVFDGPDRYNPHTGERNAITIWSCSKVADSWFSWGHSWFAVDEKGDVIPRY